MFETWLFASLPLWTLDAAQRRKSKSKEVTEPQPHRSSQSRFGSAPARAVAGLPTRVFAALGGSPSRSKQRVARSHLAWVSAQCSEKSRQVLSANRLGEGESWIESGPKAMTRLWSGSSA